nr:hypothetical protein [Tanacetum cinerariifolium]
MSTQQDIYAAGSESHPSMLNKENYVPWSSRLLRYAKSRPNGKLIHNSILNDPYVRRMIAEPGDGEHDVNVNETFHEQTDDELSSCETAQEIWLRVQQMMKGSDIGIQEKKAKNKHFPEKIASNLKFLNNLQPEWSRHVTIVHQTKDLHTADYTQLYDFLKYNQKEVDELKAERIAKIQDPLALMANSNNPYASPAPHQDLSPFNQNYMQQPILNTEDITDPTTAMNMALALMAKAFKLNYSTPTNNNQRISSNPRNRQIAQPVRPRRRDAAYLQTQLLIAQKEEAGIQLHAEEYDLMAAAADLDEIKEVNANCILMANLQQASTSVPQNDNDVISEDTSVEQGRETVEQHPAIFEETHTLYESLYQNLAPEVEKVNSVNRKLKETNADLTTELARYKIKKAKFVGDFKSLVKEADSSLAKHKILELEIERLLKAVVNQDIISVMQNAFVVDSSDLQTKLERTKEHFENCITKKENEYAKLWNDWYKKYTSCVSDTQNQLFQKLQNAIVELEFQVFNYARENAHLKTTYKNLFDSISVSIVQTETKIASLQNELQSNIYKNAKLRTQLFKKVSDQKDNNQDSSKNTKFAKQPISEILSKIGETNALSKPVTSNSVSKPPVSKGVNNDKVIAPGMFRISPDKVSKEAKKMPKTVSASFRTKPITVSQPSVITKKGMNSNSNGLSST